MNTATEDTNDASRVDMKTWSFWYAWLMAGHLFVTRGDITRLRADALVYSTSIYQDGSGHLHSSFGHVPGFAAEHPRFAKRKVGETFWLEASNEEWLHGVVGVAVRGEDDVTAEDVRSATTASLERAARELQGRPKLGLPKAPHLVALPSLGTGTGGADERAVRLAQAQVEAAWQMLGARDDLDVVLVAYDDTAYARFLHARKEVVAHTDTSYDPELMRALRDGTCVPFFGAGMSRGAGLPLWHDLLKALLDQFDTEGLARALEGVPEPIRGSVLYAKAQDRAKVHAALRERFGTSVTDWDAVANNGDGCHVPSLAHYLLLQLRFPFVLTTNYDHLVEHAVSALRDRPRRVVKDSDVSASGGPGTSVVKLHGCAGGVEEAHGIVLSEDEYRDFPSAHPAKEMLLKSLLLNRHFLFVGYGLGDETLRAVYSAISELLEGTQRRAFRLSFPGSPDKEYSRLETIEVADERGLAIWLDGLAAAVVTSRGRPLLGSREPTTQKLRKKLLEAGALLEACTRAETLSAEEALALLPVAGALQTSGYELPKPTRWSVLWERLSTRVASKDPAARRALLERALASADQADEVARLEQELRAHRR